MPTHSEKNLKPVGFFAHLTFFGFSPGARRRLANMKKADNEPREDALCACGCPLGRKYAILAKDCGSV